MFLRDASRLADCRKRANLCPLGSGAVAGATLTINRQAMAAELGFDGPTANSIDATSDRDFAIEFVDALSMLALHLSRWAEEMILFSTPRTDLSSCPSPTPPAAAPCRRKKIPTCWNWCAAKRRASWDAPPRCKLW
jgi:argininosuccinate lyase